MTRAIACGIVACLLSGCSSMGNMVQPLAPFTLATPSDLIPGGEQDRATVLRTDDAQASKDAAGISSAEVRLI